MPTEDSRTGPRPEGRAAPGALLLCRAGPDSVARAAHPLRDRMLLTGAGGEWSVLVPEGRPWRNGDDPVERVVAGWAAALAVGAPWPVLALWWDADRAGCTLAAGFRRPVGCTWLADGTPVGEDEAMRTFAARLGPETVLDLRALDALTRPDPATDARARMRGLLAVLTRGGVALPPGLTPGEPTERLREAVRARPDARQTDVPYPRETVRAELDAVETRIETGPLGPWLPWAGTPPARVLAVAQVTAGLPAVLWGVRRGSGGWVTAGTLLLAHGALGLLYDLGRPRD
ncbi:hypothetical protein ACFV0T_09500 [Streptomyces sp. NPDC059582]|uniref:hypothetical protein n=1 Tax=Streptomyces sp. NPDC059582 TaxID=3346875 RepID=UPI0036930A3E